VTKKENIPRGGRKAFYYYGLRLKSLVTTSEKKAEKGGGCGIKKVSYQDYDLA